MAKLEFFEKFPLSGEKPKKLIIFLHGYGSSGEDLIGLTREFERQIPSAHFISPNAPFSFNHAFGEGYQWFGLDDYNPKVIYPQILESNNILDEFIKTQLQRFELTQKDLILIGFSQGSMMAMYNSLRNPNQNAGIISYSGRLILPTLLSEKINSKPKICLIHGTEDQVLPFDNFIEAQKLLEREQIPFEPHILEGLGHNIDHRGIRIGREFLNKILINN